jgi:hypothetical protein
MKALSRRALGRATLARQLLLERAKIGAAEAIERVGGLQAQLARPPFLGLWTRLDRFSREELAGLVEGREVVRATAMRCTIHLLSARDFLALRGPLQPALDRAMKSALGKRAEAIDLVKEVARARAFFKKPRTFEELRDTYGDHPDARAIAYAVRCRLPLVQVATGDRWSWPASAAVARAADGLGRGVPAKPDARPLLRRYLGAFGPASVADAQSWSGVPGLREAFEGLRGELALFKDERGRELFDLPDAPRPDEEIAAPPRLLPDFDTFVLGHEDRSRLVADEHRGKLVTKNLQVKAVFLVDGMVGGTWAIARSKQGALLTFEPFGKVEKRVKALLDEEAEGMVKFAEPDAKKIEVRWQKI